MTRRHFRLLAAALYSVRPDPTDPTQLAKADQWSAVVSAIAAALAFTNNRFELARFVHACKTGQDRG